MIPLLNFLRHLNRRNLATLFRALRRESPGHIFRNFLRLVEGTNVPNREQYYGHTVEETYRSWLTQNELMSAAQEELRQTSFGTQPKFGIWERGKKRTSGAITSLDSQLYDNWERIKNPEEAVYDYLIILEEGDQLSPLALHELVAKLNESPGGDIFYCDEDVLGENEQRRLPDFKWPWSPERLLAHNYIRQPLAVKWECWKALGGLNDSLEPYAWWDFLLRAMAGNVKFIHIPKVLYHRSPLISREGDPKWPLGKQVLQAHLDRIGSSANAIISSLNLVHFPPLYHLQWPEKGPRVTVMIPTRNHYQTLKRCIDSLEKTKYENYEVLILDNDSSDKKTLRYLRHLQKRADFEVITISNQASHFSFSYINNKGASHARGELLLLLNDDIEVISPNWLSDMVGYHSLPGVGVVGAKLRFPDGAIQHGGIGLGLHTGEKKCWPVHFFRNQLEEDIRSMYHTYASANFSAVTGACLLISRQLYQDLGGLDEKFFPLSFNDIDLCLRAAKVGKRTLLASRAELIHFESKSRKSVSESTEYANFISRYGDVQDSYYHPSFSKKFPFALKNFNLTP